MKTIFDKEFIPENQQRSACLALVVAGSLFLSGCMSDMASVEGTVFIDGNPLTTSSAEDPGVRVDATVIFQPVDGGPKAVGRLDKDGRYELFTAGKAGVAPGEYLVSIAASKVIPSKEPGMPPSGERITPTKYANPKTSGFEFTVSPGNNTYDLQLEST